MSVMDDFSFAGKHDMMRVVINMKKVRVIYNPSSGKEEMKRLLPDVLMRLEEAGYEASAHATRGAGDATRAAETAVERGYNLVIAAGGDGTIYEVVNGLAERPNRPALGIIPAGTTNDFARSLGLPRSILGACDRIIQGKRQAVDVGKINDRYFINIAGGGTLTEVTYNVPSKLKTVLGQLAYYMKGIEKLVFLHPTHVRIEARDLVIDEEIMLFLIANSNSVGGFEKLAPQAKLSDGLFDCLVMKKCSVPELIRVATHVLRGDHIHDPHIIYFQTDYLKATSSGEVQLNLDGEMGGTLPFTFQVLPRHIDLIY